MMTKTSRLQGRTLEIDGETIVVWTEESRTLFSAIARDHDGDEIGYVTATRSARHPTTAQIVLRTSQAFRRRGLGRELLATTIDWATDEGVEFLVGSSPGRNDGVRKFLADTGRPVATRSNGRFSKFAIQLSSVTSGEDEKDTVALALASGASCAKAAAVRRESHAPGRDTAA